MTCAACGKDNREGRKFCAKCGAPLSLQCPACGAANEPDENFCGECGAELQGVTGLGGYGVRGSSLEAARPLTPNPVTPNPLAVSRKTISIVFADLMGSTALQERLDPESVNRVMDAYYQAVRGPVEAAGGTVVQLLGDGVFCAFGIPRIAEDDALRAVRAAVGVQQAFREFLQAQQWLNVPIGLRVAVNTGEVVVSDEHPAGIGDPLNVAARLQQEARDGEVLIGQATRRLVAEAVTLERAGVFALKGRAETVTAYRVVSLERPKGATTAFVGRDEELARLTAVYEAAVAKPAAHLAVLLGSPGLGKSRLIAELGRRLGGQANVIAAQCDAAGGATFAPIAEALREFLGGDGRGGSSFGGTDSLRASPSRRRHNTAAPQGERTESSVSSDDPVRAEEAPFLRGRLEARPAPSTALHEEGPPDKSLHATIESLLPSNDADRARIAAGITALLAGSPASPEETFFVIRRFLAALARQRPVVLVIDDLQWAEPLLLDLVEHLIQWGSGVPLLVLVGARPELRDRRSSLATMGGLVSDVVTLGGLDAGAAMRLAANVIGAADLPAAVAAKVLATSEGNPLFVGELVRMLVDEGAIERQGERWIVGANLAALEMPPTIHALLAARIERLQPEERTVLERAAVVGRHFSRNAVAALLGSNGGDLDARLEALRRTELIEPDSGWFLGEPVLRFHHVLIRDAAYRRLLKGTRAEMHERLANWIEGQVKKAPEHDETIGWHLEQAHQLMRELGPLDANGKALGERAAQRLSAAGRRALARDDVPVAADLLGRAIDRLDADDPARADLALDWCEALLSAGDVGAAAKAIDELGRFIHEPSPGALPRADGLPPFQGSEPEASRPDGQKPQRGGRPLARGNAPGELAPNPQALTSNPREIDRLRAWHTCFASQLTVMTAPQELEATTTAVAEAAGEFAKLGDAAGEAKAHSVHAQALARLGRVGACEAALDKALAAARKAGDRRRANAVLAGAPLAALWGPSPVTRASGRCLDVVRVLRITQGAPAVEAVALSCQGVLEALRGRTEAARRMVASSRKMVEELGIAHRLFEADVFAARIDLLEGDAATAERTLRGAYDGLRDLGLGIDAARAGALLARALLLQDKVDEAESLTRESEQLAGDDLQAAIAWRGVRAEAVARRGEHGAAIELAQAAVAIAATTDALLDHADARLALAAALRAAGRGSEGDVEERRAIELWETKGATLLAARTHPRTTQAAANIPEPRVEPALGLHRRVSPNAAITSIHGRVEAALAARDLEAFFALFAEEFEEIHHPTGSRYGRAGAFASLERLLRSDNATYQTWILATLGEPLSLVRRRFGASATGGGRFDVGEYENEEIGLVEVNERGLISRRESFAANRLGAAVARLYERYAELLPAGVDRVRAAATARSVRALLRMDDPDHFATALAPDIRSIDHRNVGYGVLEGAEAALASLRTLIELSDNIRWRLDDVLGLLPDALLIRSTNTGTERTGGGAFQRDTIALMLFGPDGLITHWEQFDVAHQAEALARFDALAGSGWETSLSRVGSTTQAVQRRVPSNAATAMQARFDAALAVRDFKKVRSIFSEGFQEIYHPTGSSYGLDEAVASLQRLFRSLDPSYRVEPLASLGPSLLLSRRRLCASGMTTRRYDVGEYENEAFHLAEVDQDGRLCRSEVFGTDHLGDAITRLYERHAERLPDGPGRERAAATGRAVAAMLTRSTAHRLEDVMVPNLRVVDHRTVGSLSGPDLPSRWRAASDELIEAQTFQIDDVLALRPDGLLRRTTQSGKLRARGGAFETSSWALSIFGPDGRQTRFEIFAIGHEAEALARFDELTRAQPRAARRVRENAATAAIARFEEVVAARDPDALAELLSERFELVHHSTGITYGRRGMLTTWRSLFDAQRLAFRYEVLATLGDSLALHRHLVSAEGFAEEHLRAAGPAELEEICLTELGEDGLVLRFELFAPDHLGDGVARLYERYAESLPEGGECERRAVTARVMSLVLSPIADNVDDLATVITPGFESVDHRLLSTWSQLGGEAFLEHIRALRDVADDIVMPVVDVLALEPRAVLIRRMHSGTERVGGGDYERPHLGIFVTGADGRLERYEIFEADCDTEALARFEELVGPIPHVQQDRPPLLPKPVLSHVEGRDYRGVEPPPEPLLGKEGGPAVQTVDRFANAATRLNGRFVAACQDRDLEAVADMHTPSHHYDDRRRLMQMRTPIDMSMAGFRVLFEAPNSRMVVTPIATRGERLALSRAIFEGDAPDGGGPLAIDYLAIDELDDSGRFAESVLFDPDDLDAAYAELDRLYWAGEGAAHPGHCSFVRAFGDAIASRDWTPVIARCVPNFVQEDHRSFAILGTTAGAEAWARNFRTLTELAPDAIYRVDHVRFVARGACVFGTWRGTHDGARFENPVLAVVELDDRSLCVRTDIYEPEQIEQVFARLAELASPAPPPCFGNVATRTVDRAIAAFAAREWEAFTALMAPEVRVYDRTRMAQLEIDGREVLASGPTRMFEMTTEPPKKQLLATRGERLALFRVLWHGGAGDVGPSEIDRCLMVEVNERGEHLAIVYYDPEDIDAAYAELDARWEAGEGAAYPYVMLWVQRHRAALRARDWEAVAACYAPSFVGHDHRLVGWGTLRGPAAFLPTLREMVELAPDADMRSDHLRVSGRGQIAEVVWVGTREGGAFESPFVSVLELDAEGRALRLDFYDPHHLEDALARFDELSSPTPSESRPSPEPVDPFAAIAERNGAWASFQRWRDLFNAQHWEAMRGLYVPEMHWEDRRRFAQVSGDLELLLSSVRERAVAGAHSDGRLVGLAGDRIAIVRAVWSGGPADGRFEIDSLSVMEVDEAGLNRALINFDVEDARAAQREAWARWTAIDPAVAELTSALDEVVECWNVKDAKRLRAIFAEDLIVEDHRRTGTGRIEGREAYLQSVTALWELAPESTFEAGWLWLAVAPHIGAYTARRFGRLPGGGEFESDFLIVGKVSEGRTTRVEIFEMDDVQAALARFEELRLVRESDS